MSALVGKSLSERSEGLQPNFSPLAILVLALAIIIRLFPNVHFTISLDALCLQAANAATLILPLAFSENKTH
jgi:hypothetical protein